MPLTGFKFVGSPQSKLAQIFINCAQINYIQSQENERKIFIRLEAAVTNVGGGQLALLSMEIELTIKINKNWTADAFS